MQSKSNCSFVILLKIFGENTNHRGSTNVFFSLPERVGVCVVWKLEKRGQGDRVSSDVQGDLSQSHRLRTAKSPHLTDEGSK